MWFGCKINKPNYTSRQCWIVLIQIGLYSACAMAHEEQWRWSSVHTHLVLLKQIHKIHQGKCDRLLINSYKIEYETLIALFFLHCRLSRTLVYIWNNKKYFSFTIHAARLWNSLPHTIHDSPSISVFKKRVKEYYLFLSD